MWIIYSRLVRPGLPRQCNQSEAAGQLTLQESLLPHPETKLMFRCHNNQHWIDLDFSPNKTIYYSGKMSGEQNYQDMPDIFICSLEAAEADTSSQQALSTPHIAGDHLQSSDLHGLGAVHLHPDWFLHIGLQQIFQHFIFLVLGESQETNISCVLYFTCKCCLLIHRLVILSVLPLVRVPQPL